ncbi:unnamed protein product [Bursaphelenchus okinawaensis]|uniref:Uncharacterized protein n=1 Tax=Bursaphelenchus okinawaensis TaxID=465554 RepID=A0A811L545_9BILA|nr:unnamed protein product [Bursaphelenchus okinawaensis]CAG9116615.1 unnamed protein product [Bursaphelenchus okinawaensis]
MNLLCYMVMLICVLHINSDRLGNQDRIRHSFFETFPEDVQISIKSNVPELIANLNKIEIRQLLKLIHVGTDAQRLRILSRYPTLYKKVVLYAVECVAKIRIVSKNTRKVLEILFLVIPDLVLRSERTETKVQILKFFEEYDKLKKYERNVIVDLFPNIETLRNGFAHQYSKFLE